MGNKNLSRSHDQKGCHAHIWLKTFKNLLLLNQKADDLETLYAALGTQVLPNLFILERLFMKQYAPNICLSLKITWNQNCFTMQISKVVKGR